MPHAHAAAVVDRLLRRLASNACPLELPPNIADDLTHVSRTLASLQDVLVSLEIHTEAQEWTGVIKQVAYDVDDLLDEFEDHSSIKSQASRCIAEAAPFCRSCSFLLHITGANRLKAIRRRLEFSAKDSVMFSLMQNPCPDVVKFDNGVVDKAVIIGRDKDKAKIKDMLLQSNAQKLSVLPIVGLAGLGKTTLARLIFLDQAQGWNFDLRIWIGINRKLDLKEIASDIISQCNHAENCMDAHTDIEIGDNLQYLKNCLQDVLREKSCLIVLDDLSSTDKNLLDELKEMMKGTNEYTKVLVTTSSEITAELVHNIPPYKLQPLSEDDCWTIFSQKAFENWNSNDAHLKEIGKKIVKRCEGIPLLAHSLGSLVQNQITNVWLAARDEELWKLERRLATKIEVFSPLYQIYYDLPSTVKLCFLYLSIFPKGSVIDKEKLIQQWIALEMIGSKHDSLPSYVHGEMCIQDLLSVQFLQVQNTHSVNRMDNRVVPTALYMHNFVHEFARHVSCDDVIILDGSEMQKGNIKRQTLQYALLACYGGQLTFPHSLLNRTRALHLRSSETITFHRDEFESLKHLRVLDLSGSCIRELPPSIGQLKHLKYLDVSGAQIQTLPSSMNRLTNLEVLDLSNTSLKEIPSFICSFLDLKYLKMQGCDRLQNLSSALNYLKKLLHLQLSCCNSIVELPDSMCNLHDLQYLDLSRCIELKHLPPLFGNLMNLENLSLFSCFSLKKLPESFGNLYFLRFLNLSGCYELEQLPESLTGLNKLEVLMLQRCCRLQDLPPSFATISDLRILDLAGCEALRVSTEMLPTNLEYLNLQRCLKLQTQPYCFDNFSKLKFLNLSQCLHTVDCLKSVGYLSNLEHLNMSENFLDIPMSFARLQKLHTLDLTGCSPIPQFSSVDQILAVADIISKMTALRFVLTKDPLLVNSLPQHILCSVGIGEHWHLTTDELVITDITRGSRGLGIAEMLNLQNRPELRFLKLEWLLNSHSDGDDLVCDIEEDEVLEKLQPNQNLECFEVVKYAGHAFPTWMMNNMITSFPYLVRLSLFHLQNCDDLPPLGQLINLRYLHIKDMPNLKNLEKGLSGGPQPFKKLTHIKLETLTNLEELSILFSTEGENQEFMFPTLEELSVLSCFKLTFKPSLPRCMRYEIRDSNNTLSCGQPLGPLSSPSPINIEISGCLVPSSWLQWLKSLQTLKKVVIDGCVGDDGAELTSFELPEINGTQESSNTNIVGETTEASVTNISHELTTQIQDGAPKDTGSSSSIIRKLLRKFNTTFAHSEESHALAVQEKQYEEDSGKMLMHLVRSKSSDSDKLSQCGSADQFEKVWGSYSGVEDSGSNSRSQYSQYATVSASPLIGLPLFTLRDLELATNQFSVQNVIGEGGYGVVYRGCLLNGTDVAIKRILHNMNQAEKEFRVEIEVIGHVRHKNIVRLLGYSIEGIHRMLVYEYVNNGNLEQWLHGARHQHGVLTWDDRMKVVLGVAKALAYLHEAIEPKVVHRDIKSSNVLIDDEFNGKLSDFGLAKLLGAGESHIVTRVMGTYGYVDPAYANTGLLNERSDVYSFGVLLLEAVTGRDPIDYCRPANEVNLVEWIKMMVAMRRDQEVVDPEMELKPTPRALKGSLLTALRCIDPDAEKRPTMGQAVRMLEAYRE